MHICLVSLDYRPYRSSGLAIYAEDLARGLCEEGHTVTVIAARRPGLLPYVNDNGVNVYRVPVDRLDWITYCWRAARFLEQMERNCSFDIVHFLDVHFAYAYRGRYLASLWQSFRQRMTALGGRPYNTGVLDSLRRHAYYRIARRLMERSSLARASGLIAACRSTGQEFAGHYGVSPERIHYAAQGIDTNRFQPMPARDLRCRLGLQDRGVLLFVGYITPRKGLEYLAHALNLLPANVHLVIIGRWAPRYRARFLSALGEGAARVHEMGFVSDDELPYYYSMADVYVSPSLLEGLGITPIEAMACGTPAIVTAASSGPEEVGNAGLVVPERNGPALAQAIISLLENGEMRAEFSQRGRLRVANLFTCQRMVAKTLAAYALSA